MTGTATVDMALVHVETQDTFDRVNSDKIAEAEALAAEALRMANEAKRAAERLAEVKKTLAMFSKKLDKVEKVVVVEKKASKVEEDEATPFEADKAAAAEEKKQEEAPAKVDAPIEEPTKEELPPPVEEEEEEFVPPPPPAPVTTMVKSTPVLAVTPEYEKDPLEAALDKFGVDKICGVDDEALAVAQAKELGLPAPVVAKKAAPAPKKVEKKAAPVVVREATPAPKAEVSTTETQIVVAVDDDEGKDFLEKTLDSWGVDRLCGVDDVALGFADAYPYVEPAKPVPFENPTRISYAKEEILQIVHSESMKEHESKAIREQQHMPRKYYQRAPTNYDFTDPFGVDHDDFVMCGKLADLCEPDLDALEQPYSYRTIAPAPVALPEPEKSILKKEVVVEAPKEEAPKNVSFQETSEDVSLRGVEPDGAKNSFDSSNANNEPSNYSKLTHGHLRSTPAVTTTPTEQRPVSVVVKVRSSTLRSKPSPETVVAPTVVEGREDEEVYRRQQQILKQKLELLDAVDSHIWCV